MKLPAFSGPLAAVALLISAGPLAFGADPAGTRDMPTQTRDVLIFKDGQATETIDAKGRDVTVNGGHNKLTITGECHALTISGDLNFVTVEAVSSISLTGGGNQVAWSTAVEGEKPQITDSGKDNNVAQAKVSK